MKLTEIGIIIGYPISFVSLLGVAIGAGVGVPVFTTIAIEVCVASFCVETVCLVAEIYEVDKKISNLMNYSENKKRTQEKNKSYIDEYKKEISGEKLKILEKTIKLNGIAEKKILENKLLLNEKSNPKTPITSPTLFVKPALPAQPGETGTNNDPMQERGLTN